MGDSVARPELHPSYQWVVNVLEHRGLRVPLLRCGRRDVGIVAAAGSGRPSYAGLKPFGVKLHLHRPTSHSRHRSRGAWGHVSTRRRVDGARLRRRDDQRPAASRDRAYVQRRADREDEARRLPREHGARQDLRPRCGRAGARERPAGRLRGRRLVPAAGAEGSPVADDAASRDDAARVERRCRAQAAMLGVREKSPNAGSRAARSATSI